MLKTKLSQREIIARLEPHVLREAADRTEGEEGQKEEEKNMKVDRDVGSTLPIKKIEDEMMKKTRKKIEEVNETKVIQIVNLTRPFTVVQLQNLLKRTGNIEDFWIDRF